LLTGSLVAVHLIQPQITWLRLAYHALGLSYNWPLLPGRRRIKALYFWKNTASAMGFMITVFAYPLAVAGWGCQTLTDVDGATILWAALFFFPFELSYEVIYDLRDAPGDAAAGVMTYPVVHGAAVAIRIVDGLILTAGVSLVLGWLLGHVPWRLFIMIVAPVLQLVLYKRALSTGLTSRFCVGLTWLGAGLLATYHLWYLTGLPGAQLP
jgi:4-hydroxybenzoate polyprenyltransferase